MNPMNVEKLKTESGRRNLQGRRNQQLKEETGGTSRCKLCCFVAHRTYDGVDQIELTTSLNAKGFTKDLTICYDHLLKAPDFKVHCKKWKTPDFG